MPLFAVANFNHQEKGVFDALDRGYLESVQVFVSRSSRGKLSLLENYNFVFEYEEGRVSGIRVSPLDQNFTPGQVHKSFKAATRGLLRSLRDIPRLPGLSPAECFDDPADLW